MMTVEQLCGIIGLLVVAAHLPVTTGENRCLNIHCAAVIAVRHIAAGIKFISFISSFSHAGQTIDK